MKAPPSIAHVRKTLLYRGSEALATTPPDRYVTSPDHRLWPVWDGGKTLGQLRRESERAELQHQRILADRAKRAERRERLGKLCGTCRGKSVEWKVGHCPACNNTGQRNP